MKYNFGNVEIQIKLSIRFDLSGLNVLEIIPLIKAVYKLISHIF
jgi:hypothetical protein